MPSGRSNTDEFSLIVRAAWLHYVGGLKQADVAKRLGVSSIKAHRLISRANKDGIVKFVIEADISECIELESEIINKFELSECEIVPEVVLSDDVPLKTLGIAGASYLQRAIQGHGYRTIGIGHGRTLAACVSELPSIDATDVEFVSLLGGTARNYAVNPHDVIHRLASKTKANAYAMPVPMYLKSADDMRVMLNQPGLSEVLSIAARAELCLVGIGTVDTNTQLVSLGMVEKAEMREVKRLGGVGEMLGCFFSLEGELIDTPLSARTVAVDLGRIEGSMIVAICGGSKKIPAILSVLRSGYVDSLVTDEKTARLLIKSAAG